MLIAWIPLTNASSVQAEGTSSTLSAQMGHMQLYAVSRPLATLLPGPAGLICRVVRGNGMIEPNVSWPQGTGSRVCYCGCPITIFAQYDALGVCTLLGPCFSSILVFILQNNRFDTLL